MARDGKIGVLGALFAGQFAVVRLARTGGRRRRSMTKHRLDPPSGRCVLSCGARIGPVERNTASSSYPPRADDDRNDLQDALVLID